MVVVRHLVQRIGRDDSLGKGSFRGGSWEGNVENMGVVCRGASGKDFLAERAPLSFPRLPEGGRNLNPQSEGGLPPH